MPHNGSRISGDPRPRSFVEATRTAARPLAGRTTPRIVRCIRWLCGVDRRGSRHRTLLSLDFPISGGPTELGQVAGSWDAASAARLRLRLGVSTSFRPRNERSGVGNGRSFIAQQLRPATRGRARRGLRDRSDFAPLLGAGRCRITFLISGETAAQGVRRRLQRSAPGGTSRPALAAAGRTTPWAAEPDRTRPRSRPLQQIVIRGGRSGIPERGDERPPQATPFID